MKRSAATSFRRFGKCTMWTMMTTMTAAKEITDARCKSLEANWVWDPKRGDIPFKRPRLTDRNIDDQRKHARPGKLIHWSGGRCWRKSHKIDASGKTYPGGIMENSAVASHIENVNCLCCRRNYYRQ